VLESVAIDDFMESPTGKSELVLTGGDRKSAAKSPAVKCEQVCIIMMIYDEYVDMYVYYMYGMNCY
jgi:hypothetical protein